MTKFKIRVVTPERVAFDDEAVSLIVPAAEGYLGVLAHHAPLLALLRPGTVTVRVHEHALRTFRIAGGFLEVGGNRATVLADGTATEE